MTFVLDSMCNAISILSVLHIVAILVIYNFKTPLSSVMRLDENMFSYCLLSRNKSCLCTYHPIIFVRFRSEFAPPPL